MFPSYSLEDNIMMQRRDLVAIKENDDWFISFRGKDKGIMEIEV
jgi:hypothetical protein